jgi:thiol-disulfide isomerase/thioredoxin
MVFLHIDKSNALKNVSSNDNPIKKLDNYIYNPNNKIFILIYMEGCGPCMNTRPEWEKLKSVLHKKFSNRNDIIIVDIDTDVVDKVKGIKSKPNSFPTIRFITNRGNTVENYEDSKVKEENRRTIDSFVEWIKIKTGENNITTSEVVPNKYKKIKKQTKVKSNKYKYRNKNSITKRKKNYKRNKK